MHDLIFWYTGWIVWTVIAAAIAIGVLIAMCAIIGKMWYCGKNWNAMLRFMSFPPGHMVAALGNAYRSAGAKTGFPFDGDGKRFMKFILIMNNELHKNVALPKRGNLEASTSCSPWTDEEAKEFFRTTLTGDAVAKMDAHEFESMWKDHLKSCEKETK